MPKNDYQHPENCQCYFCLGLEPEDLNDFDSTPYRNHEDVSIPHKCGMLASLYLRHSASMFGWYLEIENTKMTVIVCPFCGEKLSKPE